MEDCNIYLKTYCIMYPKAQKLFVEVIILKFTVDVNGTLSYIISWIEHCSELQGICLKQNIVHYN